MKIILLTLLVFSQLCGFAQDRILKTFSGKPAEENTCVLRIKLVDIVAKDSSHNEVVKPKIERLVNYLSSCDSRFTFDSSYQDKAFKLVIPKYFSKVSYELGNQKFAIVLIDTSPLDRAIVFSYGLDDSYKNHFLTHNNMGFKKTGKIKLNDQIIHRFINWDGRNAGTIFTSNHLHVSYFTKSKEFESELEEIISRFNW
jgi:hypothetical protein